MDALVSKLLEDKKDYNADADYRYFISQHDSILYKKTHIFLEKLRPFADAGNIRAIVMIMHVHLRDYYLGTNHTDVYYELMKYYAKVIGNPHVEKLFGSILRHIFEIKPKNMSICLINMMADMKNMMMEMRQQIKMLAEDNKNLRLELQYMPPGSGYKRAEDEFKKCSEAKEK